MPVYLPFLTPGQNHLNNIFDRLYGDFRTAGVLNSQPDVDSLKKTFAEGEFFVEKLTAPVHLESPQKMRFDEELHVKIAKMRQILAFCAERDASREKVAFYEILLPYLAEEMTKAQNAIFVCWAREPIDYVGTEAAKAKFYELSNDEAMAEDDYDVWKQNIIGVTTYLKDNY